MPVDPPARWGPLEPALAEVAHRLGAGTVGVVRLGEEPPLVPGPTVRGDRLLPGWALPTVAAYEVVETTGLADLPDALERVPDDALAVVVTAWALATVGRDDRLRFLQHLDTAATRRTVAWLSVEGVGVAPAVPTLGDRPASGHSIVGLAVFRHGALEVEAVGRCWSRGRWVSWLVGP